MKKKVFAVTMMAVLAAAVMTVMTAVSAFAGAWSFRGGYSYNGIFITDDPGYFTAANQQHLFDEVSQLVTANQAQITDRLVFVDVPLDATLVIFNPNGEDYAGELDFYDKGLSGGYSRQGLLISHNGGKVRIPVSYFVPAGTYGDTVDLELNSTSWHSPAAAVSPSVAITAVVELADGGRLLPQQRRDAWPVAVAPSASLPNQ